MGKCKYIIRVLPNDIATTKKDIELFKSCGWQLVSKFKVGSQEFITLEWASSSNTPVYPVGFEPDTKVTPIETDKFSRPV